MTTMPRSAETSEIPENNYFTWATQGESALYTLALQSELAEKSLEMNIISILFIAPDADYDTVEKYLHIAEEIVFGQGQMEYIPDKGEKFIHKAADIHPLSNKKGFYFARPKGDFTDETHMAGIEVLVNEFNNNPTIALRGITIPDLPDHFQQGSKEGLIKQLI